MSKGSFGQTQHTSDAYLWSQLSSSPISVRCSSWQMPHVTMLVSNRAGATYTQKSTMCRDCGKRCGKGMRQYSKGMRQYSKGLPIRPLAAFSVRSSRGTPKRGRGLSASKPMSKHWDSISRDGGDPPWPPANGSGTNRHCRSSLRVCDTSKACSQAPFAVRGLTLSFPPVHRHSQRVSSQRGFSGNSVSAKAPLLAGYGLRKADNMPRAELVLIAALVSDKLDLCSRAVGSTSDKFLLTACRLQLRAPLGYAQQVGATAL